MRFLLQYYRPYCPHCKLIYGKQSIGILKCNKCGNSLIFKSFSPWLKIVMGILITILALGSTYIAESPIIWIGGFIMGPILIINSLDQWEKIRKLDKY